MPCDFTTPLNMLPYMTMALAWSSHELAILWVQVSMTAPPADTRRLCVCARARACLVGYQGYSTGRISPTGSTQQNDRRKSCWGIKDRRTEKRWRWNTQDLGTDWCLPVKQIGPVVISCLSWKQPTDPHFKPVLGTKKENGVPLPG